MILTLQVRLLALGDLFLSFDSLNRTEQGDAHPTRREVPVTESVHVVDRDRQIGRVRWQRVAVDLCTSMPQEREMSANREQGCTAGRRPGPRGHTAAMGMASIKRSPFESGYCA